MLRCSFIVGMRWVLWADELPSGAVLEDMVRFIRDGLQRRDGDHEGGSSAPALTDFGG